MQIQLGANQQWNTRAGHLHVFFIATDVKVRIFWCTLSCHNHHVMTQVPGSALYELVIYPNLVLFHGEPVVIPWNSAHWVLISIVGLADTAMLQRAVSQTI